MKRLIILLIFVPLFTMAQTEETKLNTSGFNFGVVPQYAIISGLRTDFDLKLNDKNHWLVLAPQFFVSNEARLDWDYNSMFGFGLEVQHKIFINRTQIGKGVYLAYGPTFNFYSVKDDGLSAYNFEEDGGNYIGLEDTEITTNIYKLGANVIVGVKKTIADFMYIDPYIGVGVRLSYDNKTSGLHDYYNEWWADMGYSGTLMVAGVRFGIMF